MTRRVFILGAGASISATHGQFPSIETIFKCAKELGVDESLSSEEIDKVVAYSVRKFGLSCFDGRHKLDIEKMLTLLDIDIESGASLDHLAVKDAVLALIRHVIVELESDDDLVPEFLQFKRQLSANDMVISFNWDRLLDRVFVQESELYELSGWHQWQRFTSAHVAGSESLAPVDPEMFREGTGNIPVGKPLRGRGGWDPTYLKLHGSIDWVTCINENCKARGYLFRVAYPLSDYHCASCSEVLKTVIVPPVLNKNLRADGIIRRLWNTAARAMREAEEIIIWGYGMPPTDFYAENLLRLARGSQLRRVVLINPLAGPLSKTKRGFIRKFESALGLRAGKALETYSYFDEWLNRETVG